MSASVIALTQNLSPASVNYQSIQGLFLQWLSTTTISVSAGLAKNALNWGDIQLTKIAGTTMNAAVNGVNGLDVGVLAATTLYAVYVIGSSEDIVTPATIISTNFTQPLMPSGYDLWRRIGAVATDSAAHFIEFFQSGSGNERFMFLTETSGNDTRVLNGGTAHAAYAAVAMTHLVPPNIQAVVILNYSYTPAAAANAFSLRPTGSVVAQGYTSINGPVMAQAQLGQAIMISADGATPSIDYIVTNGDALSLFVGGYVDTL